LITLILLLSLPRNPVINQKEVAAMLGNPIETFPNSEDIS